MFKEQSVLNQVVFKVKPSFVTFKQYDPGQVTLPLRVFEIIMELRTSWGRPRYFDKDLVKAVLVVEVKVSKCKP